MSQRPPHALDANGSASLLTRIAKGTSIKMALKSGIFLLTVACIWFLGPLVAFAGHVPLASVINRIFVIFGLAVLITFKSLRKKIILGPRQRARFIHVVSATLAIVMVALLSASFYKNSLYITKLEWGLDRYKPRSANANKFYNQDYTDMLVSILPQLEELANLNDTSENALRGLSAFGFRQTYLLAKSTRSAYQRGLENLLQPLIMAKLEEQLSVKNHDEFLYEALVVYIMMNQIEYRDSQLMAIWIELSWQDYLSPGDLFLANVHFDALSTLSRPANIDRHLVDKIHAHLQRTTMDEFAYAMIKAEIKRTHKLKTWRLIDMATVGKKDLKYFVRTSGAPISDGIPFLYTVEGYRAFLSSRSSVLDHIFDYEQVIRSVGVGTTEWMPTDSKALDGKLAQRYAEDYIKNWEEFINDLGIAPIADVEKLPDILSALSSTRSPIKTVLKAIIEQTELVQNTMNGASRRLAILLQSESNKSDSFRTENEYRTDPALLINNHFELLNELFRTDGDHSAPINETLETLTDLNKFLAFMKRTNAPDQSSVEQMLKTPQAQYILARIDEEAGRQPAPLKYWMKSVSHVDDEK